MDKQCGDGAATTITELKFFLLNLGQGRKDARMSEWKSHP